MRPIIIGLLFGGEGLFLSSRIFYTVFGLQTENTTTERSQDNFLDSLGSQVSGMGSPWKFADTAVLDLPVA